MAESDEIFGLPFLFTGGLPNSLDKFTEGNLRCFLIYLIEVSAKANRLNVWEKPAWWSTHLIPYSPVEVDTSRVPPNKVTEVLRELVANCYRFYKATRILEVSRQLAELPRILLKIKDNGNNTKTLYDAISNTIYVTVRPENLTYDAKSLDKVSKKWRDNYADEDVSFCEIKASSEVTIYKRSSGQCPDGRPTVRIKPTERVTPLMTGQKPNSLNSKPVYTIDLADESDDEDSSKKSQDQAASTKTNKTDSGPSLIILTDSDEEEVEAAKDDDDELIIVNNTYDYCFESSSKPPVIVLSDSESEETSLPVKIISCTSLCQDFPSRKSILHPLLKSPSPHFKKTPNQSSPSCSSTFSHFQGQSTPGPSRASGQFQSRNSRSPRPKINYIDLIDSSDDEESKSQEERQVSSNDRNSWATERTLRPRLRRRIEIPFPPSPPPVPRRIVSRENKKDFLCCFGLRHKRDPLPMEVNNQIEKRGPDLKLLTKSSVWSVMPLDWLSLVAGNKNTIFISKRGHKSKSGDFLRHLSTDKDFVTYSIQQADLYYQSIFEKKEERKRMKRAVQLAGSLEMGNTIERWYYAGLEKSRRVRRLASRRIRSCMGDSPSMSTIHLFLSSSSLVPCLVPLPSKVTEHAMLGNSVPLSMPVS